MGAPRCSAWFAAAWTAVALFVVSAPAARAQDESLAGAVKATFLYRFGDFVTWPPGAFANPLATLNICVVGEDVFGEVLDQAIAGEQAGGHPLAAYRVSALDPAAACHIAYIAGSSSQSAEQALRAAQGAAILTVTDAAAGGSARGMVHFEVVDDRVRFHVDEEAAARNGLTVSSRLLGVALSVRRRPQ